MASSAAALEQAWYRGAWWLWFLRPLEFIFRLVVAARRLLFKMGLLASYKTEKPLVVVGNITVGGTGKTPVVMALVEHLQSIGFKPGVVSRGYGSSAGVFPHRVSDTSTAADCGDEALQLFLRTGCPCVVAPRRADAVKALLRQAQVDVILSDDGLQHYALDRDMEIVVLDAERGVGNGFCLPAGPLREPQSRLCEVDHVLYRGSTDTDKGFVYLPLALVNLASGEHRSVTPQALQTQVYAVAGIGQPQQFLDSLTNAGFKAQAHIFKDHHSFVPEDFSTLTSKPIVMTEKDAVKCADFADENFWYLKIEAQLPYTLLQSVAALIKNDQETLV
ncbi:MAG: tetraacyldisaccharide 4'-kinase [Halioglobus sp.]|jgi:tetraacyldisaccharide 4'-kinase